MNNVMGIINVSQEDHDLQALTNHRCQASLPFGGRYRIIDFMLSSMVQSNIRNVAVFTSSSYCSLLDHLGAGKDWDLDCKQDGLFTFPLHTTSTDEKRGDLSIFREHMDYLEKSNQEYVLLSSGSLVINIDVKPIVNQHIKSDTDITVVYQPKQATDTSYPNIEVDDFQHVTCFDGEGSRYGSLDIVVMKKNLLMELIKTYSDRYLNLRDVLRKRDLEWTMKGYNYAGYAEKINTIKDYYNCNMKLLDPYIAKQLLIEPNEIYTKLKDEPPTKYLHTSTVENSIIANGCVIEGHVENSVLFRGVHVQKGASIKNSIVMRKCQIEEFATLDGVILDKEVVVMPFENLQGDMSHPQVISKKKIVGAKVV